MPNILGRQHIEVNILNLLNEKIRVITYSIARLKRMEALTPKPAEKVRLKQNIKELQVMLDDLLVQTGEIE